MTVILCAVIMSVIFGADLVLKNRAERKEFSAEGEKRILGGRLILRRYHNHGAMLGLGRGHIKVVTAVSVLFTLLAVIFFVLSLGRHGNRLLRFGLSLLLGGAFSNTYDRLRRQYVVDYISFGVPWKRFREVVFNLSDFCIMTGALLAAIGGMR